MNVRAMGDKHHPKTEAVVPVVGMVGTVDGTARVIAEKNSP